MGRWKLREAERAPVPVYFSNPDLLWATDHTAPRFGQGAFAAAFRLLYKQVVYLATYSTPAHSRHAQQSPLLEIIHFFASFLCVPHSIIAINVQLQSLSFNFITSSRMPHHHMGR